MYLSDLILKNYFIQKGLYHMTFGKAELVSKVSESCRIEGISKAQMTAIVTAVFEEIKTCVNNGDRVTIVNFGRFEGVAKKSREMDNKITNGPIHVEGKYVPKLKVSKTWANKCTESNQNVIPDD